MFKFAIVLLCFTLVIHHGFADSEVAPPEDKDEVYDSYRLPTAVTPENYRLEVITHLNDTEGFAFRGVVWITVRTRSCLGMWRNYKSLPRIHYSVFALISRRQLSISCERKFNDTQAESQEIIVSFELEAAIAQYL